MIRFSLFAAFLAGAALTAPAIEVPLQYKAIPPKDVMNFPGGFGAYAQVRATKPAKITKEPKAVSKNPVYGELEPGAQALAFRLDESKDGGGYDQLLIDLNRNGDLTDEKAIAKVPDEAKRATPAGYEQNLFGPISLPSGEMVAGSKPVCYAQVYLYNIRALRSGSSTSFVPTVGQMRLRAGWYLAGTTEVAGAKQTVALYDGDSNMRIGDAPVAQFYNSGSTRSWYFRPADTVLLDADGSGEFDNDQFGTESQPFGRIVYLRGRPMQLSVAKDCASMKLEPWSAPLAEVSVEPRGAQVRDVALARENGADHWELLRAEVRDGKIAVPPGKYRFNACVLAARNKDGDPILASGSYREIPETLTFAAGRKNTLRCGGTLDVKVEASKDRGTRSMSTRDKGPADSDYVVSINATVQGAAGEVYSSYAIGKKMQDEPPKPSFTILDSAGKSLANGNLEYG